MDFIRLDNLLLYPLKVYSYIKITKTTTIFGCMLNVVLFASWLSARLILVLKLLPQLVENLVNFGRSVKFVFSVTTKN